MTDSPEERGYQSSCQKTVTEDSPQQSQEKAKYMKS